MEEEKKDVTSNSDYLKDLQAQIGNPIHSHQGICPACGYCPCCGRGGNYWNYPYYPYPNYPISC
jgi:hypothetical protein